MVLALPVLLGAKSDKWLRLAEHDLMFAGGLAMDGVRFGPRFMDEVIVGRVFAFGCNLRPSKLAGLDGAQIRQIYLYSEHHCNPWYETWANELWPCEGRLAPRWCKSDNEELLAAHLKIGPYFEGLTTGLRNTDDLLERYNIMAVIADRLGDDELRDYPKGVVSVWLSEAVSVFLEKALPQEALGIGWLLNITPFGDNPSLGQMYRSYLVLRPDATVEDRRLLIEVARALDGEIVSDDVRALLHERYGRRPAPPPPPAPPDRTDPRDIGLLVNRVNTYYRLMREEKFSQTWDLVALDYREAGTLESYVRTTGVVEDGFNILAWRVKEIRVKGDQAKVLLETRRNERLGLFRRKETVRSETDFWVFENGAWYNMVAWPTDWKDGQGVEIQLPQEADGAERDAN